MDFISIDNLYETTWQLGSIKNDKHINFFVATGFISIDKLYETTWQLSSIKNDKHTNFLWQLDLKAPTSFVRNNTKKMAIKLFFSGK